MMTGLKIFMSFYLVFRRRRKNGIRIFRYIKLLQIYKGIDYQTVKFAATCLVQWRRSVNGKAETIGKSWSEIKRNGDSLWASTVAPREHRTISRVSMSYVENAIAL